MESDKDDGNKRTGFLRTHLQFLAELLNRMTNPIAVSRCSFPIFENLGLYLQGAKEYCTGIVLNVSGYNRQVGHLMACQSRSQTQAKTESSNQLSELNHE